MDDMFKQLMRERAHMVSVHKALDRSLEVASEDPASAEFFGACVDYVEFIMGRFYAQDQAHLDHLKPKVPKEDTDSWNLMNDVQKTFDKGRKEVANFVACGATFRKKGADGQAEFVAAARAYTKFFQEQMSKLKHSIRYLMAEHLTPEQFRDSSSVTEESIRREKELFDRLEATAPDGVTIEVSMERPEDAPAPPHRQA